MQIQMKHAAVGTTQRSVQSCARRLVDDQL